MAISKTSTGSKTAIRSKSNYQGIDLTQTFATVDKVAGYRNREDKTMLAPNWMVAESQNVLIDITGRLKSRKGFTIDGQTNTTITPIRGYHDWEEHRNSIINMRSYSGIVQFRRDNGGTITWESIKIGLSAVNPIVFTNFWDNTEKINVLLFVDGTSNIYEWNGATTTVASVTTNTITTQGTSTWAELGFYASANKKIMIRGVEYTYTGGESTTTLTGVTPDPTAQALAAIPQAGDLVYQSTITTANSAITSMLSTFKNSSIANLDNQIYFGSTASNSIYVSALNNYKTVAFTATRVVGEGALITLRAPFVGFAPQEDTMYITAGKSQWYQTKKTLSSSTITQESFQVIPLKVSQSQAAISQYAITHDRNSVVYISNETKLNSLGRVDNIYQTPMINDYSYAIVRDMDSTDWTNGWVKYTKAYVYMGAPVEGKLFILNMTDPSNVFWEAPQTGSFAGAYVVAGEIHLHGYATPESYKWLDSYSDNGNPILSRAVFPSFAYGRKGITKYFNEYWVDGYINANTELKMFWNYDLDGCATNITKKINGSDSQIVCMFKDDASLGKVSLGKKGLGTTVNSVGTDPLPPYFNVIKVGVRKDFYFLSPTFESYGVDYHWEILSFGPLVQNTMYGSNAIKAD